jgi:hypothetical protein
VPSDRPKRIALGFHAGGALSLRINEQQLTELQRMLTNNETVFREIETADGPVLVNLGQVIYLRVESDEQRIGF